MAGISLCSEDGCNNRSHARGRCAVHYARWSRANPGQITPAATKPGTLLRWLTEHTDYRGDDCLMWPFSRTEEGYGQIRFRGKNTKASRVACILAHGEPPSDKHEAAHSCGHSGCVNPSHLRWATPVENRADRILHGTDSRGDQRGRTKLTAQQVRDIRALAGVVPQRKLAPQFGICRSTLRDIVHRRLWSWLS